jgi:hypothetical protein|tara:strand:+ start:964 stop:1875 length:912 start_codon:yes stop_codon:yes gene_type:complete
MKKSNLTEIIREEIQAVLEVSMTRKFTKAVEELQKIQLAQQKLRKAFVAEKDATKKEKLKQAIIKMHKTVQKAEMNFNDAVKSEPIEDDVYEGAEELAEKSKGLWANIRAKRKRGEKPAHKNSKAHKDAVKAAKSINKEGKLNERSKTAKQYGLSDDFDDAVADLKDKEFTTKGVIKLAKKYKQDPKKAIEYVKDAFEWLWKEGKLNEDAIKAFNDELNDENIKAKTYTAQGTGRTVQAQFTDKKWDDGVPVTKFLTRGGYKTVKTPKGKFKLIETGKFWYYEISRGWAAVNRKNYGTPPFDY